MNAVKASSLWVFIFIVIAMNYFNEANAQSVFIKHKLSHGISVDIPRDWEVISRSVTEQANAATEAVTNKPMGNTETIIAANCFTVSDVASATFFITMKSIKAPTQAEVMQVSDKEIEDFVQAQKTSLLSDMRKVQPNISIYSMSGNRFKIGGFVSVSCEYSSNMGGSGVTITKMHFIYDSDRMVVITESYKQDENYLKLIFDKIESSITIEKNKI